MKTHLGIGFQLPADADEAASVFLYVFRKIKCLGNQLVAQMRLVMIGFEIFDGKTSVKLPGTEESDPVVKDLDLDIGGIGIVPVNDGIEQGLAQGWQRVGEAFPALKPAIEFEGYADMR